jgi:hypothetical protein
LDELPGGWGDHWRSESSIFLGKLHALFAEETMPRRVERIAKSTECNKLCRFCMQLIVPGEWVVANNGLVHVSCRDAKRVRKERLSSWTRRTWTPEDDAAILAEDDVALASRFRCTIGQIQARRAKLRPTLPLEGRPVVVQGTHTCRICRREIPIGETAIPRVGLIGWWRHVECEPKPLGAVAQGPSVGSGKGGATANGRVVRSTRGLGG